MTGSQSTAVFAELHDQIGHLSEAPEAMVVAGHLDLGDSLWLSADPNGRARMTCQPTDGGFVLRLEEGDSGAWACLGMRFSPKKLAGARYLALIVTQNAGDVVAFTPSLRYFRPAGMQDAAAEPVLMAGGSREHLSWIPIDPDLLADASGCELNLFFQNNAFVAEFTRIEPLVMS